jgi:hypothetical protein
VAVQTGVQGCWGDSAATAKVTALRFRSSRGIGTGTTRRGAARARRACRGDPLHQAAGGYARNFNARCRVSASGGRGMTVGGPWPAAVTISRADMYVTRGRKIKKRLIDGGVRLCER